MMQLATRPLILVIPEVVPAINHRDVSKPEMKLSKHILVADEYNEFI